MKLFRLGLGIEWLIAVVLVLTVYAIGSVRPSAHPQANAQQAGGDSNQEHEEACQEMP
jgi:hypothetical protein